MAEQGDGTQDAPRTESHDPDVPEAFLQFMRSGWRDDPLHVTPRPEVPNYAKRRAALSEAFPGETLIIPTGNDRVRANDTDYRFRPGSDFFYLTGDHDPDSVLVLRPSGSGHDAELYTRQRPSRENDDFFPSRDGELWVGRRQTLAEKSTALGIETAAYGDLGRALADCAPARTRVLRGIDPNIDRAGLAYEPPSETGRDRDLARRISELKLVKDEWEIAQLQDAIDAPVRGFEDVARGLPADRGIKERLIEGIFGMRARVEANDVGYSSIVGAGAHGTILHWIRNDGVTVPG